MASQTKLLFPSQAHSSCSLSHIRRLQLHSPRYPGSSTWSHPLYHSISKPPIGTLGFKLCLEMNNSYHLHHHSRLTTITSLLDHCNIRLTDLLFSLQPESSFKTISDHVTPLLKSLQRIPILRSVKPKAFPRPSGPYRLDPVPLWPQALLLSTPLPLLSWFLCHTSHTPPSRPLLAVPTACTSPSPTIHVAHCCSPDSENRTNRMFICIERDVFQGIGYRGYGGWWVPRSAVGKLEAQESWWYRGPTCSWPRKSWGFSSSLKAGKKMMF